VQCRFKLRRRLAGRRLHGGHGFLDQQWRSPRRAAPPSEGCGNSPPLARLRCTRHAALHRG
jgi:hypothetical protein